MNSGSKTTIRTCDDMFTVPTGPMTGTDSTNVAPDVRSTYRNNRGALRPHRHVRLGRETVICVEHVHTVLLCVSR